MSDRSYADITLKACNIVRKEAEEKLERSLTAEELAFIYNAGSLMTLELVERIVVEFPKEKLIKEMQSTSFPEHLTEMRQLLPQILEKDFLSETISEELKQKIMLIPYVYTANQIIQHMENTPTDKRLEALENILDELI
ncbi:MAG: hypothetical protein AAF846_20240 [Chloroflexota bacterium]